MIFRVFRAGLRWFGRACLALVAVIVLLMTPVMWNQLACVGDVRPDDRVPLLPPEHRRPEARTLMTYPEWHIVHAYDDYARVIAAGDPHGFGYIAAIRGYWSSLCALSQAAGAHGGARGPVMQTAYTIGVSFTAELLAKAAYEETVGRAATWIRGGTRAPLDDLSAEQAKAYAAFLRQVPWYEWNFSDDRAALRAAATGAFRDRERAFALGLEYGGKAAYAGVIAAAVAATGEDALTLRMIVRGLAPDELAALDGVTVIGQRPQGVEIETPRYRALTVLLAGMADAGADFVEIAGNDDILFTAIADGPAYGALYSFARQGYGDRRHLFLVEIGDLAAILRGLESRGLALEHIHDY